MELENALEVVNRRKELVEKANAQFPVNGRAVEIDGVFYRISCPRFDKCKAPTYNQGFIKYLCSGNCGACATQNPDICKHENFASPGSRARFYSELLEQLRKKEEHELQLREERLRLNHIIEAGANYT